ncbi:MAG: hypothetical protein ACEQSH_00395 [Bacteroidia bacterium]
MSIRRAPRPQSGFYTLDKRISEDSRLSWAARGLMIYLMGKPAEWKLTVQNLIEQTSDARIHSSRDAVYAILRELRELGYLHHEMRKDDAGRVVEGDYRIAAAWSVEA